MPERFDGKKVVVLGAGPSGIDISLELHRNGADVILSHNDGAGAGMHGGCVPQAAPVVACRPDGGLVLRDGQVIEDVDELMLCTGYAYSMPFLSENCGLRITPDGRAIHGLLMQCVCEKHPTLSVLGIPYKIIPFPLFQDQVQFVAGLLMGTVPFDVTPESLQRISEEERIERENRDLPAKYIHCLDSHQWDYRRRLAEWTGGEAPTESVREIHEDATNARKNDPLRYRSRSYVILGDGSGEWKVSIDPRVEVETMDPCLRESTVN
jgi:Flavin-binding monooxygenase-like